MRKHQPALWLVSCLFGSLLFAAPVGVKQRLKSAPGAPGSAFPWASAQKQGLSTSYESYRGHKTGPKSKVWFTLSNGVITEVYYPRIDTVQTRDLQFLVTDGESFVHQESVDMKVSVKRVAGSLLYEVTNEDRQGRYGIEKQIWVDPDSNAIVQRVKFRRNSRKIRLYVLHNPAAASTMFGDRAEREPLIAGQAHDVFGAWQGLYSTAPWGERSVGFVGKSDGFTQLKKNFRLVEQFDVAGPGNVALTAEIELPRGASDFEFDLLLYFEKDRQSAVRRAYGPQWINVDSSRRTFMRQWQEYLSGLGFPHTEDAHRRFMMETSALVLKASEDKTYRGAVVAGLSHPWGEKQLQTEHTDPYATHGYHVVWPRDLYHIAGGFLAVGDNTTAVALLDRFKEAQFGDMDGFWDFGPRRQPKNGSFPQNFWVDGKLVWDGYQADQTAQPILLAYRLWKAGLVSLSDYWRMARDAADFLAVMGPWTNQERWEENHGISPNSAAFVIASMVAASEMAFEKHDFERGQKYLNLADSWTLKDGDNLEAWTFTHNGRIRGNGANGKYYLRIDGSSVDVGKGGASIWDAVWNPNDDGILRIANTSGSQRFRYENEVIDPSFLELVRLGVRSAKNYFIRETLPEVDALLRRDTPAGAGWYRYRFDGYGENDKGQLWPFLTGERIHYELQYFLENGEPDFRAILEPKLKGFENFANENGIFSEQVWDSGSKAGRPDSSATPLTWAHAEYLQTVRSLSDGKVFEEFPMVRARYGQE